MTAGERWAETELRALGAAGFGPRAWRRFLTQSRRRAAATRRERPLPARQVRAWSAVGLAASLIARPCCGRRRIAAPSRQTLLLWWLGIAAMLDWHLGMLEGPAGERRERLTSADALTLSRLGLAPFVATADRRWAFSALVGAAAATDLLDGRLARGHGTSRLGRDLDTTADVAVKLAAARAARRADWLPPMGGWAVVGCQTAGVVTVAATYFRTARPPAGGEVRCSHWAAPALLTGLALAPFQPRIGRVLVEIASAVTLAVGLASRGGLD